MVELGELIRRRRKALRLKQADAAEAIGVSQQTISDWESGQRPDGERLGDIAEFLDIEETALTVLIDPVYRAKLAEAGELDDALGRLQVLDDQGRLRRPDWHGFRSTNGPTSPTPSLSDRLSAVEEHLRAQETKLDAILDHLRGAAGPR